MYNSKPHTRTYAQPMAHPAAVMNSARRFSRGCLQKGNRFHGDPTKKTLKQNWSIYKAWGSPSNAVVIPPTTPAVACRLETRHFMTYFDLPVLVVVQGTELSRSSSVTTLGKVLVCGAAPVGSASVGGAASVGAPPNDGSDASSS
eukprot:FR741606.1.p1 GENE.FR741606.1~~FR741606.1.p1  ORF type:complete len:145 (-),score=6.02 FR741606.1:275-709(-)